MEQTELFQEQTAAVAEKVASEAKIAAAINRVLENMVSMSEEHFIGALKLAIESDLNVKLSSEAEGIIREQVSQTNNYQGLDSRQLVEKIAVFLGRQSVS